MWMTIAVGASIVVLGTAVGALWTRRQAARLPRLSDADYLNARPADIETEAWIAARAVTAKRIGLTPEVLDPGMQIGELIQHFSLLGIPSFDPEEIVDEMLTPGTSVEGRLSTVGDLITMVARHLSPTQVAEER